jgi:hypothetical protein
LVQREQDLVGDRAETGLVGIGGNSRGLTDDVECAGSNHEQAASIREPLDEIVSLGFVSLSNRQIDNFRCLEDAIARRLLRGH